MNVSMKKIIVLSTVLAVLTILTGITSALANQVDPSDGLHMTAEGSTTIKNVFGWNETPFAFIQFDVADDINTDQPLEMKWKWKWQYKENALVLKDSEEFNDFTNDPLRIWRAPEDWDVNKKIGEWSVKVSWRNHSTNNGWSKKTVNFGVTPEPLSSILFLIGGTALGAKIIKRKKAKL